MTRQPTTIPSRRGLILAALACAGILSAPARPVAAGPAERDNTGGAAAAIQDSVASRLQLSLREAIARARSTSPRLGSAHAQTLAAHAALSAARAQRMPQLDLTGGYTRQSDVPELSVDLPGRGATTIFPDIPDNWRARAQLSLPLFTGGRIGWSIRASQQQVTAATGALQAAQYDLDLQVSAAYWDLVAAQEREHVTSAAVATFDAHLADARNREKVGLAAHNEVLAVEVERDRGELAHLRASHDLQLAQAVLRRFVGTPTDALIQPTDDLDRPVEAPPPTAALIARALAARPERASALARIDAATAHVKAEQGAYWPQLFAAGGYDMAEPNRRILPLTDTWNDSWDVGVNLSLNVFDGGRVRAAVSLARAQAEEARQALRELDDAVQLEVTQRALEVRTARASVEVARRNLGAAQENRKVANDRYREGVVPSSELLDAETALLNAGLDLTQTRAQLQVADAALQRAVGGRP